MNTTITSDRISCGIREISVEPYRTTTRYGDPVEVWAFEQDVEGSTGITVTGLRVKTNGETYARASVLSFVEVPADIAGMFR